MTQMTIDQAMQIAAQHHMAGRLPEAEQLYRRILAQMPTHAPALHYLGLVAHQVGRHDVAVDLIRRALAFRPNDAEAQYNLGNVLKSREQLDEAITAYRQAIVLNPNLAEAHNNLGSVLKEKGLLDEAIAAYRRSIAARPTYSEAQGNLGNALKEKGQLDEAVAAYREAIALRPDFPEVYYNLGIALRDHGKLDEAIAAYRHAIVLNPGYAKAHSNLGLALNDRGQFSEAIAASQSAVALDPQSPDVANNLGKVLQIAGQVREAAVEYRRAIALKPNHANAQSNLGNALREMGQIEEAIKVGRDAVVSNPRLPDAHNNLGNALRDSGRIDEAVAAYREAVLLRSDFPEAHNNLGIALTDIGQIEAAVASYRQAIALRSHFPEAWNNLGSALKDKGLLDEAIASYRRAITLKPDYAYAHSNLVYTLHFHTAYDAWSILKESERWSRQHAEPLRPKIRLLGNDPDPRRRLKIGYVSPDFREHPVGRFLLVPLEHHDHSNFEIICYSDVRAPDQVTDRLGRLADRWRSILGMSDEQVAQLIRDDGVDILIDLTMHMANSRLRLFARKPAPVQVTWLAYPGTTGMDVMDYRLTDRYLDPLQAIDRQFRTDSSDGPYAEQSVRLPDCWFCYRPHPESPPINEPPALGMGYVTFGCLNNFCKVSKDALKCWCRLMREVPGSRLVLHASEGSHRQSAKDVFASEGIDPDRLAFIPRISQSEYLRAYQQIDICLDPFPYSGGTTSCDSMWMGVPLVSLSGQTAVGRLTATVLHNIGMPDLVAKSLEEYIGIAKTLAGDLSKLAQLRSQLRERMHASPLMDESRFTRNLEASYREMWRIHCEEPGRARERSSNETHSP